MKKLLILGAGGHGKVIADIAAKNEYTEIAFLEDEESILSTTNYKIVGKLSEADKYPEFDLFVAIGNPKTRERIQTNLIAKGLRVCTLIHPQAVIASNVRIGIGTAVMAGAIINPGSTIGNGCIINTGATVDHDNTIHDYAHISVGSHLAGTVAVGNRTWIGIGAIIINNITICSDCMVGAGAVVVKNIDEPGIYIGVPAHKK